MEFQIDDSGKVVKITLEGDMMGGPESTGLKERLHQMLDEGKRFFLVDLNRVHNVNSSGLGILIGAVGNVRAKGGDLKLVHVKDKPLKLMQITRMNCVFEIFQDEDTALASFQ